MVNLLIALTVNKTEELAKVANIIRLEKTVKHIDHLETLFKLLTHKQIFVQLKQALGEESEASPWKICVKPFSREEQTKKNALVISHHTNVIKDRNYSVYVYDDRLGTCTVKLPFKMPYGVVKETLDYLKDKKLHALKKNQQILEREINTYLDTDKMEIFKRNSPISMQKVVDNLSSSRLEPVLEETKGPLDCIEQKITNMESSLNYTLEDKLDKLNEKMDTHKKETDQFHQALDKLNDKLDTILVALQEPFTTQL